MNAPMKGHWRTNYKKAPAEECTSDDGIRHDSVAEMKRWNYLRTLQAAGYISNLERQIPMNLILPNGVEVLSLKRRKKSKITGKITHPGGTLIKYKLDFRYVNKFGMVVHEEYKGHLTPQAELKLAVVQAIYGIQIHIAKSPKAKVGGDE